MKNILVSLSAISLSAILAVSFAAPSQIYIDDLDFDYSLDALVSSAESYKGYSTVYDYNSDDNQAENVPVYIFFDTATVDGALRIQVDTEDIFDSEMIVYATVPNGSNSVEELSAGIEVIEQNNKDVGINLSIQDQSLEDVLAGYLGNFEALNYDISPLGNNLYQLSQLDSIYNVLFVQKADIIEIKIFGL